MNIGQEFKLGTSDEVYVITDIIPSYGNTLRYEYCPKHLVGKLSGVVGFFIKVSP